MSVTAIISDIMHNASGFLMGIFKGKAENAFGALFSKEQADEAALETALVQAEELESGISTDFMEILGKLNPYQNELVRKTIGMLITIDAEATKGNKDFKPVTPRAIKMIVRDLKGKDARAIAKRLSAPDSPLWQKVFDYLKLQWPEIYTRLVDHIEKLGRDADTASLRFVLGNEYNTIRAAGESAGETPQQIREELLRQGRSRLPATPAEAQARVREVRRNANPMWVTVAKVFGILVVLYLILEPIIWSAINN